MRSTIHNQTCSKVAVEQFCRRLLAGSFTGRTLELTLENLQRRIYFIELHFGRKNAVKKVVKTYKGVSLQNPITGERWMNVTPNVTIGGNTAVFNVQTFAWWIKTSLVNQATINKWIPAYGLSTLKYSYSLHARNNSITGLDESNNPLGVNLYPNPSANAINLVLNLSEAVNAILEIYDSQGKLVANPKLGNKTQGEHNLSINVSNLQNGLYLLKIVAGENSVTKRFVKQ